MAPSDTPGTAQGRLDHDARAFGNGGRRHIRSVNYTIDTGNRSVYLIGSARTQAELDTGHAIARYVPGVKRVVSYVEIRPGRPVAAEPPPPPARRPRTQSPPARRRTDDPIEVQKL